MSRYLETADCVSGDSDMVSRRWRIKDLDGNVLSLTQIRIVRA